MTTSNLKWANIASNIDVMYTGTAVSGTVTIAPDVTVTMFNGIVIAPNGTITTPNGTVIAPNGTITTPNDMIPKPNETVTVPNETVTTPSTRINPRVMLHKNVYQSLESISATLARHMYRFDAGLTDEITTEMIERNNAMWRHNRESITLYAVCSGGTWSGDKEEFTRLVINNLFASELIETLFRQFDRHHMLSENACDYAANNRESMLTFLHGTLGYVVTYRTAEIAVQHGNVKCLKYALDHMTEPRGSKLVDCVQSLLHTAIISGYILCVECVRNKFPDVSWPLERYGSTVNLRMYMYLHEHGFVHED